MKQDCLPHQRRRDSGVHGIPRVAIQAALDQQPGRIEGAGVPRPAKMKSAAHQRYTSAPTASRATAGIIPASTTIAGCRPSTSRGPNTVTPMGAINVNKAVEATSRQVPAMQPGYTSFSITSPRISVRRSFLPWCMKLRAS